MEASWLTGTGWRDWLTGLADKDWLTGTGHQSTAGWDTPAIREPADDIRT
ncbi:hypothetical protein ACLRGH_08595 [Arthrobacter koreensis]